MPYHSFTLGEQRRGAPAPHADDSATSTRCLGGLLVLAVLVVSMVPFAWALAAWVC